MAMHKQKFREIVLQLLYSDDVAKLELDEVGMMLMETLSVSRKAIKEAYARMQEVLGQKQEIDQLIASVSHAYTVDRIQRLELNVLRLGIYELLYDDEIPPKVAIAEAMRLAKKFSTKESASYVNAILDALYQKQKGEAVDETHLQEEIEKLLTSQKLAEEVALKQ